MLVLGGDSPENTQGIQELQGCGRIQAEDCCDRQKHGATFFLQWAICGGLEKLGGFSSSP